MFDPAYLEFSGEEAANLCCLRALVKTTTRSSGSKVTCPTCNARFSCLVPSDLSGLNKADMLPRGVIFSKDWEEAAVLAWFGVHGDSFRLIKDFKVEGTHYFPQSPSIWCAEPQRVIRMERGVVGLFSHKSNQAPTTHLFPSVGLLKDEPGEILAHIVKAAEAEREEELAKATGSKTTTPLWMDTPNRGSLSGVKVRGDLAPFDGHAHKFEAYLDVSGALVAVSSVNDDHAHIVYRGAVPVTGFIGLSSKDTNPSTGNRHQHDVDASLVQ